MDKRYDERIQHLRARKEQQMLDKIHEYGSMNEDDYGSVLPPKDFAFQPEFNDTENHTFYGAKTWASNFRRLVELTPPYVDPMDALAGRWMVILQRYRPFKSAVSEQNLEMAPIFNYDHLKPTHKKYGILPGIGKMHHFAPDYTIGLREGFGGLLKKVRTYAAKYPDKGEFYQAEEEVLLGIRTWMEHTIAEIWRLHALEQDPMLKENLEEMGRVNEWLLENPPSTFKEACQFIGWINMANRTYDRAGSGCQLDEILRPYYEKDIADGILDDEEAKFILASLFIIDPHYYQVGGPGENGRDVTSPMSFLILEAAHAVKTSVNVTIRVHKNMDERLLRRGVEILFEDRKACPRFVGADSLINGFMRWGYSEEIARKRIAVGCQWMSLPGLEYTLNDLIKINLAKVFEVALDEMMTSETRNVEELYRLYSEHLCKAVECVAEGIDFHMQYQHLNAPELILNLISHGPIEKGLDASNGGLDYVNIGVDASGLATVADSFAALEQRIEQEKRIDWDTCYAALKADFQVEDGERIRLMLKNSHHFGAGGSLGDVWALRVSKDFSDEVVRKRTPNGYLMIPGLFTWANTVMLGKMVGATPNGRRAYAPISHGANPDPGFRKDGALTAMSEAIAAVQPGYGNTAPFQLELNPSFLTREHSIDDLISVIKSHFEHGGTLINVNILDREKLMEAQKDPMKYPSLIVRVTGFTAYFAALSSDFRQLVIDRLIDQDGKTIA